MRYQKRLIVAICVAAGTVLAEEQEESGNSESSQVMTTVEVTGRFDDAATEGSGRYATGSTSTATGLTLSPRETPQSVSVITATQLEDFKLTSVNEALESSPGITVERVETDRTYYTARGFDITNFQYDGIAGAPMPYGVIDGDLDTAIYDRVEVVRGATGLMTGAGQPSAAINFVRKRPTLKPQGSAALTVGSWNDYRLDLDTAGPISDSTRGRVVVALQDRDSYLDRYAHQKAVFYGAVETDLGDNALLTVGHAMQDNRNNSPLWGALPLYYADGSPTDYDVSTSTAADWSYWNGEHQRSFAELSRWFDNEWEAKAIVTRREFSERSKLFYVYGTPDRSTSGSDLYAYPSRYDADNEQLIFDVNASGPYNAWGRRHELMLGASWAQMKMFDVSNYGQGIGTEIPHLETWDGDYPEPSFDAGTEGSQWEDEFFSAYSSTRLNLADNLSSVIGARLTSVDSEGSSYGVSKETEYDTVITPYAGMVHDLDDHYSLYGSYTEIFSPQTETDINRERLDPIEGRSYELGLKGEWADGRLQAGLALFRTVQDNVAEAAGTIPGSADTYYRPVEGLTSEGFEIDLAGEIARGVEIMAGLTHMQIREADGEKARTYIPRNMLRLSSTYQVRQIEGLKLGASLRWQDDIYYDHGGGIRTEEDAYALVDLMAAWKLADNLKLDVNIKNVTNEKHYASLYWAADGQAFYGAPRSISAGIQWKY
ncbi:MAG: TonB-dependent siderophore receptor [Thiohalophilus sp.]